jgi:hypothetical protein
MDPMLTADSRRESLISLRRKGRPFSTESAKS